ncbi:AAA family ATPase [Streptomyces fuscigenes]|uniref:AAA family ATPase n=1 Tax=Streptomyces fuscigenes TaxID=1528880 RepID=UPI001F1C99D4|nr:AAA family ATPase [Streptomyces fuscigenes]MCF3962591.1 AAA family ATPase [Streptomyces fuscigenes]
MGELSAGDRTPDEWDGPPDRARWRHREATALLGAFDVAALDALGMEDPRPLSVFIARDCERVATSSGRRWRLRADVRAATLDRLTTAETMLETLSLMPEDPSDIARTMAREYISGSAVPLGGQSPTQLHGTLRVAEWLHAAPAAAAALAPDRQPPPPESVRRRIALAETLRPLRHLVDEHFVGREPELRSLAEYVGFERAGAAQVVRDRLRRLSEPAVDPDTSPVRALLAKGDEDAPPILFHGPGGVGKSTLLARFLLDHAGTESARPLAFAYLSFDRPDLSPQEPLTVLAESARQLGLLFERATAEAHAVEEAVRVTLSSRRAVRAEEGSRADVRVWTTDDDRLVQLFAELAVQVAGGGGEPVPLLLVLDTMEQAQRKGPLAMERLWSLLSRLRRALPGPRLRIVLAAREPLAPPRGFPLSQRSLKGLDDKGVHELLERHLPVELARRNSLHRAVVRRVGRNPLSLKLAAGIVRGAGTASGLPRSIALQRLVLLRLNDENVQAYLYQRLLENVDDESLRKIAWPALVVRQVTPAVIREVLAGPCGLGEIEVGEAARLFHLLSQEATLVESVPGEVAALHRADVRTTMLPLLTKKNPDLVRKIHEAAVGHYSAQGDDSVPTDPQDRAEELYHRLALGRSTVELDNRWSDEAGGLLEPAFEELPPAGRVYLAEKLGLTVDESLYTQADAKTWVRQAARIGRLLLDEGRPAEVLRMLHQRGAEADEWPQTVLLEIEALAALGQLNHAINNIQHLLDHAIQERRDDTIVDLVLLGARIAEDAGHYTRAQELLLHADESVRHHGTALTILKVSVARLRLHRRTRTTEDPEALRLRCEIIERSRRINSRQRARNPLLVRDLAAEIGDEMPELVIAAALHAGVDLTREETYEALRTSLDTEEMIELSSTVQPSGGYRAALEDESPPALDVEPAHPEEVRRMLATRAEQGIRISGYLEEAADQNTVNGALVEVYRSEVDEPAYGTGH